MQYPVFKTEFLTRAMPGGSLVYIYDLTLPFEVVTTYSKILQKYLPDIYIFTSLARYWQKLEILHSAGTLCRNGQKIDHLRIPSYFKRSKKTAVLDIFRDAGS